MSDEESPVLVKAVCDEMIRENLRRNRLPVPAVLPRSGADKIYVSEIEAYVRAGLRVLRQCEKFGQDSVR